MQSTLLRAAQAYVASGLSVFPVQGKRPNTKLLPEVRDKDGTLKHSWIPFQTRRPNDAELTYFFTDPSTTGLALVCGQASNGNKGSGVGLFIIDVDRIDWIPEYKERCGSAWSEVTIQRTGSGGLQLAMLCRAALEMRNQKLAMYQNPKAGQSDESPTLCGIETRGSGGYACGAPSIHPNGNQYELIQGRFTKLPLVDDEVVLKLLEAAQSMNEVDVTQREVAMIGATRARHMKRLTIPRLIIDTFNDEMRLIDYLETHGYTYAGRGRMMRPMRDEERRGHMPGVLLTELEDAAYFYSSNDPLNQYTNALGQPFHDRAGCAIGLEYNGEMYTFLENEGQRLGIDYHRPNAGDVFLTKQAPEPQQQRTVDIEPFSVVGSIGADVVFVVDTPESVDVLARQGVASLWIPRQHSDSSRVVDLVEGFSERYIWFGGPRDGYVDLHSDMAQAKVIDAAGLRADELLGSGATAQAVVELMQSARLVEYAVGAAALRPVKR